MDWQEINKQTLVNQNYAYFDTGAAAPPPIAVVERVHDYLLKTATLGTYLPSFRKEVYQDIERIRLKLATFIGAEAEEIAFTKNGTESICIVAQGIDFKEGDEVIIPDTEMISNLAIWYQLEKTKKIKVVRVSANKECIIAPKTIENAINKNTKLITVVALSNVTGALQPIQEICDLAQKHNILTHINASQAVGMLHLNVNTWGCDFLSACGRKGLRAIEGSGFLYVKQRHIDSMLPCLVGWWNSSFEGGEFKLSKTAKRFEAGCPIIPAIYSIDTALDIALAIGLEEIENRVRNLTQITLDKLEKISCFEFYGPKSIKHRLGLIPFNLKGYNPYDLVTYLEKKQIIIESGHFMAGAILDTFNITAMARISLHYFNDREQIERLTTEILNFMHLHNS